MNCKKCKREIPEESIFCPWCGRKQVTDAPTRRKRPNGTGTVYKLKGKRKKPWVGYVWNPQLQKQQCIGTFKTEAEANIATSAIAAQRGVSERHTYTLKDLYDEWSAVHFRTLSASGEQGYKTAWKYLQPIANVKVRDLRTVYFQKCIDACAESYSRAQCEKIRQLASQLCKKAMEYDLLNKNYAQFIVLPKAEKTSRQIFSDEELALLWSSSDNETVRIILTLIYTGFRPNELFALEISNVDLKNGTLCSGSKTAAGMNRVIPILPPIRKFIEKWYSDAFETENGEKKQIHRYLITTTNGGKMDLSNFRARYFYPTLLQLGILELPEGEAAFSKEHPPRLTPYCTRHTFASIAVKAGVKAEVLQALMGHEEYSTTADYYEHFNFAELQAESLKMVNYKLPTNCLK